MGEVPLRELFRTLYAHVVDSKVSVADSFDDLGNIWVPCLHRNLNDWEMGKLCRLLSLLDGLKLDPNVGDGWEWVIFSKGKFSSNSLYLELVGDRSVLFPHISIWIPGIPSKMAFFLFGILFWIKFSPLTI